MTNKQTTDVEKVEPTKRDLLIEAAIDLFGRQGFWNTSTASVAKHAGVATGTLFNHFKSKEDLISQIMFYLKREMLSAASVGFDPQAELREQLRSFWHNGWRWVLIHCERFHLMEQIKVSERISKHDPEAAGNTYAEMMALLKAGVDSGQLQPIAPELIAEMMTRQGQAIVEYLLSNNLLSDVEIDAHLETGFMVFWRGISLATE
ncbi:TetR/AcrR family transcriptional regulator [Maritalea sp.]|uniref:TetR/AcrR family transcriptional regulator n=1 Tax=Maritalea sp. TaxID=2003361 RepID=UPI003EF2FB01